MNKDMQLLKENKISGSPDCYQANKQLDDCKSDLDRSEKYKPGIFLQITACLWEEKPGEIVWWSNSQQWLQECIYLEQILKGTDNSQCAQERSNQPTNHQSASQPVFI